MASVERSKVVKTTTHLNVYSEEEEVKQTTTKQVVTYADDESQRSGSQAVPTSVVDHKRGYKAFINRSEQTAADDKVAVTGDKLSVMQEAFAYFDEDASGSLNLSETMHVVQSLGYNPTFADVKVLF